MAKYIQRIDGEWIQPIRENFKHCCCDCGLVHLLDFRIHKGHVQFRARRAPRSTAQVRRHMKPEKAQIATD